MKKYFIQQSNGAFNRGYDGQDIQKILDMDRSDGRFVKLSDGSYYNIDHIIGIAEDKS